MAESKKYQDVPRYRVINDYENDFKKSWKNALKEGLKEMGVELQRAVQRTPLEKGVQTKPLNSLQSKQDIVVKEIVHRSQSGKSLNLSEISKKAQLAESTVKEVVWERLIEILSRTDESHNFPIFLEKGRKAVEGEIRVWNGEEYQKTGGQWVKVGAGKRGSGEEKVVQNKISQEDISSLKTLKKHVSSGNKKEAVDHFKTLSESAKRMVPKSVVDSLQGKLVDEEAVDESKHNYFDEMINGPGYFNEMIAERWFDSYDEQIEKLSSNQLDEVEDYRGDGYAEINSYCRGLIDADEMTAELEIRTQLLEEAINSVEIKNDIKGYRAITGRNKDVVEYYKSLKPGEVIIDTAFCSTTINKQALDKFKDVRGNGIEFEILIERGSRCLPMQNIGGEHTKNEYKDEWEVLLNRNSRFTVVKTEGSRITLKLLK